jgi:hypothetical protein
MTGRCKAAGDSDRSLAVTSHAPFRAMAGAFFSHDSNRRGSFPRAEQDVFGIGALNQHVLVR